MPSFFVLYLPNRVWQSYCDTMKILCRPDTQSPAHITVRGPYGTRPDVDQEWRKVSNIHIRVLDVGTFFEDAQNTVFLRCESPELASVWWKKHYRSMNPHITIYDGDSREFAERVLGVLRRHKWRFSFVADHLHEYVSNGRQMGLDLTWSDYGDVIRRVHGASMGRNQLQALSDNDRLELLAKVAEAFRSRIDETATAVGNP